MKADCELIRRYLDEGEESAFAELVERRFRMVYHTALRVAGGDSQLAQDATQIVFTDLVRKARQLRERPSLAGWLHTSARFTAAKLVRGERRRQAREATVTVESAASGQEDDLSRRLRPALGQLNDEDRTAVLLRYFEGNDLSEIALALALNENAARSRVVRALVKLRRLLVKRGVSISGSALAVALSKEAVAVTPVGLKPALVGLAIAPITKAARATFLYSLMKGTSLKYTTALAVLAALGTEIGVQNRVINRFKQANADLSREVDGYHDLESRRQTSTDPVSPVGPAPDLNELARMRAEHHEMLRLRNETSQLRRELDERKRAAELMELPAGLKNALREPDPNTGIVPNEANDSSAQLPRMFTRVFKVNSQRLTGYAESLPNPEPETKMIPSLNSPGGEQSDPVYVKQLAQNRIRSALTANGLTLEPRKACYFDNARGLLMVRATMPELTAVSDFLDRLDLNAPP